LKDLPDKEKKQRLDSYMLNVIIKNNCVLAKIILNIDGYKIQDAENDIRNLNKLLERV
jgi:hypothetical protein